MVDHPWLIGSSLWKPRKAYADSRAFTDTPGVFKRGASAVSTWPVVYWPTLHSRIASTDIYVGLIYSEYVGASVTWRSAATCCRLQPYVLQAATLRAAGCNPTCCRHGHRLGALLHRALQEKRSAFKGRCLYLLWLSLLTMACSAHYGLLLLAISLCLP